MKLQIAVVDDDAASREYLGALVNKWAKNGKNIIALTHFSSAEAFLFEHNENNIFDILLLDIEMGKINGVELAKQVRASEKNGCRTQIVFITGYPDFISEGYDVAALHYLMKPVKEEKLFEVLSRAKANAESSAKKLIFHTNEADKAVYVSSIIYAEAFSHMIKISTEESTFEVRMKLSELAEMLGENFIQTHRSYIVNLAHIESLTKTELVLDSGKAIPISRAEQQKVHSAFVRYFKGDDI